MKKQQFQIDGLSNYMFYTDSTVLNIETGEILTANKKGNITMKKDDGEKTTQLMSDLMALGTEDILQDIPEATDQTGSAGEGSKDAPKEKTAEEIAAEKYKSDLKRLKNNVAEAQNKALKSTPEELLVNHATWQAAIAELDEFTKKTEAPKTPEHEAALEVYNAALLESNNLAELYKHTQDNLNAARTELKKFQKVAGTTATGGTQGDVPQRAPKLNYEIAQSIRKDVSEGMSAKDAATKYECTPATIGFICKYVNYKLKDGDTAYLPVPTVTPAPAAPATTEA